MNTDVISNLLKGFMPLVPLIIAVFVLVGILFVVKVLLKGKKSQKAVEEFPYEKNPDFLTDAEKSFYQVLYQVIGKSYLIFAKVSLSDIVKVKKGLGRSIYQTFFNKIQSKHIDFVVINPKSLEPVMAIELDDGSHNAEKAKIADKFKDDILRICQIKLIRFNVQRAYTVEDIKSKLMPKN